MKLISQTDAEDILSRASALMVEYPNLRLGQAIINSGNGEEIFDTPWSSLYNELCPSKAVNVFYTRVEKV